MKDVYRVVCSENQKLYPGQVFVDFMPAGQSRQENCLNHDAILQMRRTINPGVDSVENGLILTDYGFGRPEWVMKRLTVPNGASPDMTPENTNRLFLSVFVKCAKPEKKKRSTSA